MKAESAGYLTGLRHGPDLGNPVDANRDELTGVGHDTDALHHAAMARRVPEAGSAGLAGREGELPFVDPPGAEL